jgi:hypothetical protein
MHAPPKVRQARVTSWVYRAARLHRRKNRPDRHFSRFNPPQPQNNHFLGIVSASSPIDICASIYQNHIGLKLFGGRLLKVLNVDLHDPDCPIAVLTVAKVLAYAGNVSRFNNAKALSAFAGVCPQQRLSGTSVKGRTLVSKRGHADLRKALYMPGMVAIRYNPLIKDMAARLKAKGMMPKAIIADAMHKLTHLIYGVLKTRQPFDANWAKKATEVVETAVSAVVPLKINALTLDFQDGI